MPELPEVETIRRIIEPQVAGRTIVSVELPTPQIVAYPAPELFSDLLIGKTISGMGRRGKFLWLKMENDDKAVFHLRMTGLPMVMPPNYPMDKHTHLILNFSGEAQFRYVDQRRFGRFWYLRADEQDTFTGIGKLGIEPDNPALTAEYLKSRLAKRKKTIKEMLHEQSIVAGIGNIYSDEILFAAKIYPGKNCTELSAEEWHRLAEAIPEIIAWGIKIEDMTPKEYFTDQVKEYRDTEHLRAYGHSGKPCVCCGTALERIKIGGRSSTYCPICQKAPIYRNDR